MAKEKDEREKLIHEVTNDMLTKRFVDQVGHKARVERHDINNEHMDELRSVLAEIGEDFVRTKSVPEGMSYVGSACVHIYKSEALGMVCYVEQLNLSNCPEALAGPAASTLRGRMLEYYGHRRQKKRTGF